MNIPAGHVLMLKLKGRSMYDLVKITNKVSGIECVERADQPSVGARQVQRCGFFLS